MKKAQITDAVLILAVLIFAVVLIFAFGFSGRLVLAFLGLALFILSFVNTNLALILLIFSMLLSPELALGGIAGREVVVRLDDIILFVVFLGWIARMAINKELGLLKTTTLNKPILIYIGICILATAFGIITNKVQFSESIFYILKYIEYFLVFFMVSNLIRDQKQVTVFIVAMLITCVIVSIYALWSHFHLGIRASAPFEGKLGEANTLAGYLVLMMSVVLGLFIYLKPIYLRVILSGILLFITFPFIYTFSRSGWMAFAAMYFAFLVLSPRAKFFLFLVLLLTLIFAPRIVPKLAFERVQSTFVGKGTYHFMGREITLDESTMARIQSMSKSYDIWKKSPVLGVGVPGGEVLFDVQYARILREVGLVGLLSFIWMIVRLFRVGWQGLKADELNDFGRGLALGFICALFGLLVMGLGAEVFILIRIMEPFWFLAAIVVTLPQLAKLEKIELKTN